MTVLLPPKIFRALAPVIQGNVGVAREVRFTRVMKVFTGYFGCVVEKRHHNIFKVSPPAAGRGIWFWSRTSFFIGKPSNGRLVRDDIYALRKTLKNVYDWDHKTIVRSPERASP